VEPDVFVFKPDVRLELSGVIDGVNVVTLDVCPVPISVPIPDPLPFVPEAELTAIFEPPPNEPGTRPTNTTRTEFWLPPENVSISTEESEEVAKLEKAGGAAKWAWAALNAGNADATSPLLPTERSWRLSSDSHARANRRGRRFKRRVEVSSRRGGVDSLVVFNSHLTTLCKRLLFEDRWS
jgi:hypothetical protein